MIKKAFYCISTVLQVLFLITAYGIQYFSMKKMGMMRYIVYLNHKWETQYPIALIQYIVIAVLLVLAVISCILYLKTRKALPMLAVQTIITIVFVLFTLTYSTVSYRSYYFTSLMLALTALIQHIKILVNLIPPHKKKV